MDHYIYDGPVKEFNRVIASNWHAETYAESREKARSNMTYQYKKKHNKSQRTNIILTGEVKIA